MGQSYKFCNVNTRFINEQEVDLGGYRYHTGKNLHVATINEMRVIFDNVAKVNNWTLESIVALGDYGTLCYFDADNDYWCLDLDISTFADSWLTTVWEEN